MVGNFHAREDWLGKGPKRVIEFLVNLPNILRMMRILDQKISEV